MTFPRQSQLWIVTVFFAVFDRRFYAWILSVGAHGNRGLSVDFRGFSVDFVFTVGSSQLSVELWVLCSELLDLRVFQGITEPKAFP